MTCDASRPRKLGVADVFTSVMTVCSTAAVARRARSQSNKCRVSDHRSANEPGPLAQAPTSGIRREDRVSSLSQPTRAKIEVSGLRRVGKAVLGAGGRAMAQQARDVEAHHRLRELPADALESGDGARA